MPHHSAAKVICNELMKVVEKLIPYRRRERQSGGIRANKTHILICRIGDIEREDLKIYQLKQTSVIGASREFGNTRKMWLMPRALLVLLVDGVGGHKKFISTLVRNVFGVDNSQVTSST